MPHLHTGYLGARAWSAVCGNVLPASLSLGLPSSAPLPSQEQLPDLWASSLLRSPGASRPPVCRVPHVLWGCHPTEPLSNWFIRGTQERLLLTANPTQGLWDLKTKLSLLHWSPVTKTKQPVRLCTVPTVPKGYWDWEVEFCSHFSYRSKIGNVFLAIFFHRTPLENYKYTLFIIYYSKFAMETY